MNLTEAFQALDKLDEEVFSVTDTDLSKLQDFMTSDDSIDEVDIFNLDAECDCEEESHEGETVLDCCVCHSKLLKPVEEVIVDEESELVNKGEECPYCFSTEGYKVVGEIKSVEDDTIEADDDADDDTEIDECTDAPVITEDVDSDFEDSKEMWEMEDPDFDFEEYVDGFYIRAVDELSKKYKDLYVEPSIQSGMGEVFASYTRNDGKKMEASWDYEYEVESLEGAFMDATSSKDFFTAVKSFIEKKLKNAVAVEESLKESAKVDLLTKDNTIASVLKDNMDKLYSITNPNELRNAIIEIVDASNIADKPAVQKLKRDLFSKKSVSALLSTIATYMTGDKVIKTNRRGKMTEDVADNLGTDLDKYQKWVDYDMKKYHKISDKTNNEIKKAGLQLVKGKYGDYQVIAGNYDIDETINKSNSTKESNRNESLNEASNDRIQKLLSIIDNSFEVLEDAPINEDVLEEAKQIRLSSIPGVTRDPSNDFSDDGNRFQTYLYKGIVPITYLRADGDVYITIAFHHLDNINYKEYQEFPSYMHKNDFNGVSVEEFDPQVFKKNLDAAYEDITMFLGNVKEVDPQQLEDRIKAINNACKEYEEKVKQYIKDNALDIMKLTDYQFKRLKGYVTQCGTRTADAIRDASASSQRAFMSDDVEELKKRISSSWNFKYIEELINSVKESLKESRRKRRKLGESYEDVTITTEDFRTTMTSEDNGKVSVTTEPIENTDETDEVIAPVSEETEREIEINSIDKDTIEEVIEKCLKENFNNVTFFRTNNVTRHTNAFVVEGVIGLKSRKKHNTRFLFESSMTDNSKVSFSGKNRTLKDKSLSLIGTVDKNNKLISESLTISSASKDVKGE